MSKCSVGHAGTLCSASSLLCLVVVWSSAAVGEHHVQVRKGCKWKDYKQWCTFGRKLSIVATQDTIWRKTKKKRNKQTFFLEWAEKERKRGGRKPLRRTPTPAQRSPSFQKVKEYSRSSHSSEVIKPLIFIIDMVEPSDQNHERYVDTAADIILMIFRQLKWRAHITLTNLGWFVFGVLLKAAGRRWKRGFYHTNKHCFPQTCCSTLRTNLLRSLQDINFVSWNFKRFMGQSCRAFCTERVAQKWKTLVDAYKHHLKKKQFICRFTSAVCRGSETQRNM